MISQSDTHSHSDLLVSCRICLGEEKLHHETFLSPCACSGSVKYVHRQCLITWMRTSHKKKCEICHSPYNVSMKVPFAYYMEMAMVFLPLFCIIAPFTVYHAEAWTVPALFDAIIQSFLSVGYAISSVAYIVNDGFWYELLLHIKPLHASLIGVLLFANLYICYVQHRFSVIRHQYRDQFSLSA